jgi:hypothetical protein
MHCESIILSKNSTKESCGLTEVAMDGYQKTALFLGLSPFMIAGAIALLAGGVWLYSRLKDDLPEIALTGLIVWAVVMVVMLIVGLVCMRISPHENFADGSGGTTPSVADLAARVEALEKDACGFITRADQFIQNDIGKPGQDDPSLVTAAQQKARTVLPGPITDCPATVVGLQGLSAEIIADLNNRVTRLETTLMKFTQPIFQHTYDTSVKCEGFADSTIVDPLQELAARISALETAAENQKTNLLKPIDDKTASLQRGELSDCDKKKAGKTAIAASNKMPAGTVTGV